MKKPKVLFICVHNSARSQMAAAFLNDICPDEFEAHSAGLELGAINPLAIQVMLESGIDISANSKRFSTPGDLEWPSPTSSGFAAKRKPKVACPIFAANTQRLSWPFEDPSMFRGSPGAKLEQTRLVRDAIMKKINDWCDSVCARGALASSVGADVTLAARLSVFLCPTKRCNQSRPRRKFR